MATRGSILVGVGALAGISLTLLSVLAANELWFDQDEPDQNEQARPPALPTPDLRVDEKRNGEPSWRDLGLEPARVIGPEEFQTQARSEQRPTPEAPAEQSADADRSVPVERSEATVDTAAQPANDNALAAVADQDEVTAAGAPIEEEQVLDAGVPLDQPPETQPEPEAAPEPAPEPVPCGGATCSPTMVCCNPSCNICTVPGGYCDTSPCEMELVHVGALCGLQSCSPGSLCCCNEVCIAPGQECDPDLCDIDHSLQLTVPCGLMTLCDEGEVCCNPSCGTCVEPGETCDQSLCP